MTDPKILHQKFVRLGKMRHKLKNELLTLLPEIYKSGIFKKYAATIVEYAGKYGDIAKSTVIRRLGLEKKLSDKPFLKEAIKSVGLQKVAIVANLATPETDKAFADKVRNMSKSAIQTLAKELREKKKSEEITMEAENAIPENIKMELDEEMTFMFLKLKNKLGKNLSNREIMRKILETITEKEFPKKKAKSVTGHNLTRPKKDDENTKAEKAITGDDSKTVVAAESRYIPAQIRRKVLKESSGRCRYPGCNKPYEVFHHTERFAGNKSHKSLVAVCRNHHEFMHNGLVENENNQEFWALNINKGANETDRLYRRYRKIHGGWIDSV